MNLFIGTPAYNGLIHIDYMNSIIDFHKHNLPITVMSIGNESLITRARNTIISYFHSMKQFSHLVFIDADIGLTAEGLTQLMSHNKDVIGAAVALKGYDNEGNPVYNVGENLGEEGSLIKTNRLGTAVFILSRKAVDSLVKDAKSKDWVYNRNPHTRGENKHIEHYDVFKTGVVEGTYLSEDFYVCAILQELGYDIFVDPEVKTRHNGMYVFGG